MVSSSHKMEFRLSYGGGYLYMELSETDDHSFLILVYDGVQREHSKFKIALRVVLNGLIAYQYIVFQCVSLKQVFQ